MVETVCAFVGRGCGETTFAGATVPHRRLNALVPGAVDLLKIDVDGGDDAERDGDDPDLEELLEQLLARAVEAERRGAELQVREFVAHQPRLQERQVEAERQHRQ